MSYLSRIRPSEWIVAAVVAVYVTGFTAWFLSIGNTEFIIYVVTMLVLTLLVGASLRVAEYPPAMLWALALWGLLHMAGGGVPAGDGVLYGLQLVPLVADGEMTLLKYDQVVHAYGFGVAAWVLWHLLTRHYPDTRRSWTAYVFPALAAMGLGATHEIIEFSAVVAVEDTGVGGYINTALDLCFNALGAVLAMIAVAARARRKGDPA
ncbi:DUF2238 domain-containing protein [Psychromarinibacter sp. C21-152]|uniref:DUF2238 domain-containing protein n=1 Tax=Psychromarinibacter sediminicola TaxID=3033385 RepID=A0AAE3NRT9_9RHOB|nr:DUF2238 domain-containing protein [Psychromarinibacter sediminicola]MDF0600912.1 DUF2238 domain-containing protein [Psychromarinibacter sediminicola]